MSTSTHNNRLEFVANILTIGTCLIVCALVVGRMYRQATARLPDVFPTHSVLKSTDEIRFGEGAVTVLIGLQSTCRYCAESMPAFRQLDAYVRSRKDKAVVIKAIGAEPVDTLGQYLETNGLAIYTPVSVDRRSALAPVAIRTPSVVLVDHTGAVLASWQGLLTMDRLEEVIDRIKGVLREQSTSSRSTLVPGGES